MNPKIRKISYKLYLTLQGLVLLIGVGFLIWNIVAAVHDISVSQKAKDCVVGVVGSDVMDWYSEQLGPERWDDTLESHMKGLDHPAKKYALKELLERKCSEYLSVSIYGSIGEVGVYVKNYMDGRPASWPERAGYIGLTIGITIGIMAALFGIMKWISWLLKD